MKSSPEYREKWYKVVEDYKASGLTMKTYASSHDIQYYQFQYWVRKYNDFNKGTLGLTLTLNFLKRLFKDYIRKF